MKRKPRGDSHAVGTILGRTPNADPTTSDRRQSPQKFSRQILVAIFLIGIIITAYRHVPEYGFVFDDSIYVKDNNMVGQGITVEGILWAFTTFDAANWHPLTWLSHMLDVQFFGLNAGRHHVVNIFLHLTNTLLLLFVLARMTGAFWRCAVVAAWFAIHPLHVESVAFIAERKDLLCTFFWFLATGAYISYLHRPGIRRYLVMFLFLALGLLSKPMLVSFPFFLLIIDYWPLSRKISGRVLLEKVPLAVLAVGAAVMTILAQRQGDTIKSLAAFPIWVRIANALVSYARYIGKALWPSPLGLFYTYPDPAILPWLGCAAGALIIIVAVVALRMRRRLPYLTVGWLWYLGTLVPAIGIVQVSAQAMADRYTYVPLVGIFIMVAWGVAEIPRLRDFGKSLAAAATASVLLLMPITANQTRYWSSDIALFQRAVDVNPESIPAHHLLGFALALEGRSREARYHLSGGLTNNPGFEMSQLRMGIELLGQPGKLDGAIRNFRLALGVNPNSVKAHAYLGLALARQGKTAEGIGHLREALRIAPNLPEAHLILGDILRGEGRSAEAALEYNEALKLKPGFAAAQQGLDRLAGSDQRNSLPRPGRPGTAE